MVSRQRLHEADRHAWRRWRAFQFNGVLDPLPQWNRYRKVTKPCSCSMCGNPRRWWGQRTVQERRLAGGPIEW